MEGMGRGLVAVSGTGGPVARKHDDRTHMPPNANKDLTPDNVCIFDHIAEFEQRWKQENDKKPQEERRANLREGELIRGWIDEKMQPYMDAWNNSQKKKSRKKDMTYTQWHESQGQGKKKKGDLVHEFVFQYGDGDEGGIGRKYYISAETIVKYEKAKAEHEAAKKQFTQAQNILKKDPQNEAAKKQLQEAADKGWAAKAIIDELESKIDEHREIKAEMHAEFEKAYRDWLKKLEDMGFTVVYAYIHFDEGSREKDGETIYGTPHLHVCVSPITDKVINREGQLLLASVQGEQFDYAHQHIENRGDRVFKIGPPVQVSANKVLEANGILRVEDLKKQRVAEEEKMRQEGKADQIDPNKKDEWGFQFARFYHKFREYQEQYARDLGYEIKDPTNEHRPHLSPQMYIQAKTAERKAQKAEKLVGELEKQIENLTGTKPNTDGSGGSDAGQAAAMALAAMSEAEKQKLEAEEAARIAQEESQRQIQEHQRQAALAQSKEQEAKAAKARTEKAVQEAQSELKSIEAELVEGTATVNHANELLVAADQLPQGKKTRTALGKPVVQYTPEENEILQANARKGLIHNEKAQDIAKTRQEQADRERALKIAETLMKNKEAEIDAKAAANQKKIDWAQSVIENEGQAVIDSVNKRTATLQNKVDKMELQAQAFEVADNVLVNTKGDVTYGDVLMHLAKTNRAVGQDTLHHLISKAQLEPKKCSGFMIDAIRTRPQDYIINNKKTAVYKAFVDGQGGGAEYQHDEHER